MKRTYIFLLCIPLLPITHFTYTAIDQEFNGKLNILQQSIDTLIAQSDLDPEVAQDVTDKINDLNLYAQENIQQDIKEIRVAAALNSVLESVDKITQNTNLAAYSDLIKGFKYSARANTIQKLLIGAYPGKFKDQPYYTDPYIETVGFTLNDYFFNLLFGALLDIVAPTQLGTALSLTAKPRATALVKRVGAALAAHCAWLLQKKLIIDQQQKQNS